MAGFSYPGSIPPRPPLTTPPAIPVPQRRELEWLLNELNETLHSLKSGLEDCYALLAPVDPGSTLVVSTPRNETVKGHITRVGTRIVKGVCPSVLLMVRSNKEADESTDTKRTIYNRPSPSNSAPSHTRHTPSAPTCQSTSPR